MTDKVITHLEGAAVTPLMLSNLYTLGCTAVVDPRQAVPEKMYTAPSAEIRELRARLAIEEMREKCRGLGFEVLACGGDPGNLKPLPIVGHDADSWDSIEAVIDGAIDSSYVNTGTLAAYGVPDLPHIMEVNRANNEKFPDGVATLRADGKFQKPLGWREPDHMRVKDAVLGFMQYHGLDSRWRTRSMRELCDRIRNQ